MSARTEILQAMPSAPEMERGVLSCMMQAPEWALAKAQESVQAEHFHSPAHRLLFTLMLEMSREGLPIDPTAIQQLLIDRRQMEAVGGPATVAEIYTFSPTPVHVSHYGLQVREKAMLRRVALAAYDALSDVQACQDDPEGVLSRFETSALALRGERAADELTMDGGAALLATIDKLENQMTRQEPDGVPWGLPQLDARTGGIAPGLIIIGAETSGGKSVLAAQAAVALLRAGKRVDFYSLEMPIDLCVRRMLAHIGNLPFGRLRNPVPAFTDGELADFHRAVREFQTFAGRLRICADGGKTAGGIHDETRRRHSGGKPVDALVVDYIQRLQPMDTRASSEQQLTDASRMLKRLADALSIPVISPVQLNDAGQVRGSRMLGMDCDLFVKIGHQKDEDTHEPAPGDAHGRRECTLWVEKNRNGERWFGIPALLDGARMRFTEV